MVDAIICHIGVSAVLPFSLEFAWQNHKQSISLIWSATSRWICICCVYSMRRSYHHNNNVEFISRRRSSWYRYGDNTKATIGQYKTQCRIKQKSRYDFRVNQLDPLKLTHEQWFWPMWKNKIHALSYAVFRWWPVRVCTEFNWYSLVSAHGGGIILIVEHWNHLRTTQMAKSTSVICFFCYNVLYTFGASIAVVPITIATPN